MGNAASALGNGCDIPQTELRGIKLKQLRKLYEHIEQRCAEGEWEVFDVKDESGNTKYKTIKKTPETINLYDVNQNIILPLTKERKCSFVELIATEPQPPKWFVSHWWGEPVKNFISCLSEHAQDRKLSDDTTYWVGLTLQKIIYLNEFKCLQIHN